MYIHIDIKKIHILYIFTNQIFYRLLIVKLEKL
jgi:hypothetical protein